MEGKNKPKIVKHDAYGRTLDEYDEEIIRLDNTLSEMRSRRIALAMRLSKEMLDNAKR